MSTINHDSLVAKVRITHDPYSSAVIYEERKSFHSSGVMAENETETKSQNTCVWT